MSKRLPVFLAALTFLAAPGCASMQQRVTESENRSANLATQVADLQATQQDIIARLTQLREDLERQIDPVRAQQASGGADLRSMQAEIASLQEQVLILTDQLAAIEARGSASSNATGTPPTAMPPAGGRQPGAVTEESEADTLFNSAYGDYTASQFVLAVSGFEEFVSRYPDSARAPDALYWIGESLAAQDLHREARQRFLDVGRSYPEAPKVPDAILRAALEAVELGEFDTAIRELGELIAAHTRSDAALIGCMQLDRLGAPLPAGCQRP